MMPIRVCRPKNCPSNRWIKGNVQVLRKHALEEMPLEARFSTFLQLTAWASPLVLYPLIVILGTLKALLGATPTEVIPPLLLSHASFGLYSLFIVDFFISSDPEKPLDARLQAAILHFGTYWTSLGAVVEGLSGKELVFERTRKDRGSDDASSSFKTALLPAVLMLAVGLVSSCFLDPAVGLGWSLLASLTLAKVYLHLIFERVQDPDLA